MVWSGLFFRVLLQSQLAVPQWGWLKDENDGKEQRKYTVITMRTGGDVEKVIFLQQKIISSKASIIWVE